jgi:hypothetical protein
MVDVEIIPLFVSTDSSLSSPHYISTLATFGSIFARSNTNAREQYINGYLVTVGAGGIDNSSKALPVSAAASVSTGFRILI